MQLQAKPSGVTLYPANSEICLIAFSGERKGSITRGKRTDIAKLRNEASKKHVEMCNQFMSVLSWLNKMQDKYDDINDSDNILTLSC